MDEQRLHADADAGEPPHYVGATPNHAGLSSWGSHPASEEPRCTPSPGPDYPDDAFQDSNCDGIDGDALRAVFVAPSGDDAAVGTLGAPVRTLARGVAVALGEDKDVYACAGRYTESIALRSTGVSIHGGYDCERRWKRVPERAIVEPAEGPALVVENVPDPLVFDRLSFRAAAATGVGESSIAVVLVDSGEVAFAGVEIRAGAGGDGEDGKVVPDPYWSTPAPAKKAIAVPPLRCDGYGGAPTAECLITYPGASGPVRTCPDGAVVGGGEGGSGGNVFLGKLYGAGRVGMPDGYLPVTGADGERGAPASGGFGTIVRGSYRPSDDAFGGASGAPGIAGMGGSGGGSRYRDDLRAFYSVGSGGGQGAYPGCGGRGGNPGTSGGASIGVVIQATPVTFASSWIHTEDGGKGGAPSAGQPGQPAGEPGRGGTGDEPGEGGGPAGAGGHGGTGGPGAGGPSVGIAYVGAAPKVKRATFEIGLGGAGGSGHLEQSEGVGATNVDVPDGVEGLRKEIHAAMGPGN